MVRRFTKILIFGLLVMTWTKSISQITVDSVENHLYRLDKSKNNKAVIAYAIKVQTDNPKIAKEVQADYYIVRCALAVNDTLLADKHAERFLKLSIKDDFNDLYKSDVCTKMANYYQENGNAHKEIYWLKLRLYKWTTEKCGVGKKERNIGYYERIISCYDKLGDVKNKNKYQKKLDEYKASKGDAWKTI